MKRYDIWSSVVYYGILTASELEVSEDKNGEWVKYEDIKDLIMQPMNEKQKNNKK